MNLNKNYRFQKIKKIISFLILGLSILFNSVSAQYEVGINNSKIVSDKIIEFDIYAKSTVGEVILSAYQCALKYNLYAINGGSLTFSYISGSSRFKNYPIYSIGIKTEKNISKLCFASYKGIDTIRNNIKQIGRFRLVNTNSFKFDSLSISWIFSGNKKSIFINNNFTDITKSSNFLNKLDFKPPVLNKAIVYSPTTLKLNFSEPVSNGVSVLSNYLINNNIVVKSASLSSDKKQITLTTSSHTLYSTYTVTIKNIGDLSGNLISASGISVSYTYLDNILRSAVEGILTSGAALKTKSGSVGEKVAYCTTTSSTITYSVYFPKTSVWYAWGRFYFEGSGSSPNSFYINIDNGTKYIFGNNSSFYNVWHWGGDGNIRDGTNKKLLLGTFTAGTHTISISGRQVGATVMIDQLLLTPDANYVPTDAMAKLLKDENPNDGSSEYNNDESKTNQIPQTIELCQNFPNPFNPTTRIKYSLSKNTFVKLIVFDILGKEIVTLVNENKQAGYYEVEFNSNQFSDLTSGIYIFTLMTKEFVQSKKMIFLK